MSDPAGGAAPSLPDAERVQRQVWMAVGGVVAVWAIIYLSVVIAYVAGGGGEPESGGTDPHAGHTHPTPTPGPFGPGRPGGPGPVGPGPVLPPGHKPGDGHDH